MGKLDKDKCYFLIYHIVRLLQPLDVSMGLADEFHSFWRRGKLFSLFGMHKPSKKQPHPSIRFLASLASQDDASFREYVLQQFRRLNERQSQRLARRGDPKWRYSQVVAESPAARSKNRYSNIIPFDYSRVRLTRSDLSGDENDYINASFIKVPFDRKRTYIATQGPLRSTLGDFWRMVVEQESRVIVCLSPEMENGMEKCARYWPEGDERLQVAELTSSCVYVQNVEPEQLDKTANCVVRQIAVEFVKKDEEQVIASRTVTQLQYLGWADFSVPQSTEEVVALSDLADAWQAAEAERPMIVHCSAGCGRSGTFCVVNSAIAWMRRSSFDREDDGIKEDIVFQLVDAFRKQRTTMVQAASQYMFCYRAIWDAYQRENK